MNKVTCYLTKKEFPEDEVQRARNLPEHLMKLVQKDYPGFTRDDYVSNIKLVEYRKQHLTELIRQEKRELNKLERQVVEAIAGNQLLSENIEPEISEHLTLGQRAADHIATFGGSWTFILIFFSFLLLWMLLNTWFLVSKPFDTFPFILLNLILSCLAAIQAPIIMMSQNRQEAKDRQRSEHDYMINLKAELEIKLLHEKLDHLMIHQNRRLLEIQEIQADYLEDILQKLNNKATKE
jgi:uncharacterized membrane protein